MKKTGTIEATTLISCLIIIIGLSILPGKMVPEAQAFRGRGAAFVVGAAVGSAGSASAEASAAASQQQAAAAQQQAALAQQQAVTAQQLAAYEKQLAIEKERAAAVQQPAVQAGKELPLGTVVSALPPGCTSTPSGGVNYYYCGGNFYQAAYQGSSLVYVTTKPK
jgi:hypothetical protein